MSKSKAKKPFEVGGKGSVRGYLIRCVHNACLDHLKRRRPVSKSPHQLNVPVNPGPAMSTTDRMRQSLEEVRHKLTEEEREVLRLRLMGRTFERIGEGMGISTTSAHRVYRSALVKVRESLGDALDD